MVCDHLPERSTSIILSEALLSSAWFELQVIVISNQSPLAPELLKLPAVAPTILPPAAFGRSDTRSISPPAPTYWEISYMQVATSKASGARPSRQRAGTHRCLSEASLLKRARGKDVAAFEELVRRTENKLYQLAMRYVRNESDAQEILQNAYLSAWRSLPTFQGRAQFGSWMHTITVNASLMLLRTRNRHPEIAIHDIEPDELNEALTQAAQYPRALNDRTQSPDQEYQCAELRRRIEIAVNGLPDTLKSTFVLRHVNGMSTHATAGELGASIPTIKTRLHRARRVLRESLGSYVGC